MTHKLTWSDLADLYKKETGHSAKIKPMEVIFDWAATLPYITVNKDGSLSLKE